MNIRDESHFPHLITVGCREKTEDFGFRDGDGTHDDIGFAAASAVQGGVDFFAEFADIAVF